MRTSLREQQRRGRGTSQGGCALPSAQEIGRLVMSGVRARHIGDGLIMPDPMTALPEPCVVK